ncbi:hypothetical protein RV12_GL001147 [Enterococcus quebecensis]|nr:hypothetical protein RV12_GL001147 [Enterococcus quebecensis]
MVVVIVVLTLVTVRDKQLIQNLLVKKDKQQEEIMDLKLEKVRLKHIIKMQDETISHMLNSNAHYHKQLGQPKSYSLEEPIVQEWHLDELRSMNQDYY